MRIDTASNGNETRLPLLAAQGNARSARAGRKEASGRKKPTRPSMREHVPSKSFGGGKRRSRRLRITRAEMINRLHARSAPIRRGLGQQSHDSQMRVTRREVTGITPVDFVYDSRGRLSTIAQGPRVRSTSYFNTSDTRNGYVQSVTNALSQTTAFEPDAVGRILQQLDPDGAQTSFAWDENSNLTSVTPPGQPTHQQTFSAVDLLTAYTPPVVPDAPTPATIYAYDLDKRLTSTLRPDGLMTTRLYDSASRLDQLITPSGIVDYDYFGLTPCPGCAPGRLQRITDPSGVVLEHSYDGMLLTGMTWSGAVNGAVAFGYDNSFRVTSETVSAGGTVSPMVFGYDPDDIVICASPSTCSPAGSDALKISLNAGNGLVTGSTLGVVTDSYTYNAFGEMASYTASVGGSDGVQRGRGHAERAARSARADRDAGRDEWRGGRHRPVLVRFARAADGCVSGRGATRALRVRRQWESDAACRHRRRALSGSYDAQDRLLSYGTLTFTYTANGELATKTDTATGETTAYQYDVRGNLVRVDLPSGDVIEYLIDGTVGEWAKKKNGVLEKQWLQSRPLPFCSRTRRIGFAGLSLRLWCRQESAGIRRTGRFNVPNSQRPSRLASGDR